MPAVLVDAGPLAALLDRSDPAHPATVEAVKNLRGVLLTVWPAVAEASHLLQRKSRRHALTLVEAIERGALRIAPLAADDAKRIKELMEKFADRRLDLADAALMRVLERDKIGTILTLDRRDFTVLLAAHKGRVNLIVPR